MKTGSQYVLIDLLTVRVIRRLVFLDSRALWGFYTGKSGPLKIPANRGHLVPARSNPMGSISSVCSLVLSCEAIARVIE
jgi:hypothetical protein